MRLFRSTLSFVSGGNSDAAFDTERAQAIIRVVLVVLLAFYIIPIIFAADLPVAVQRGIVGLYLFSIPFSLAVLVWIVRRPGQVRLRRILSIGHDYGSITYALAVGGPVLLPLFAILLWITVGNGLRFGQRYLLASTLLALCSLAITTVFNPYWHNNPYLVVTLVATAILVPSYSYLLLARVQHALQAAQEADLSKSRFLAQASHDLRQPIHAISLFTACLRDAGLRPCDLQMVENIDRSLQGVARLFKSLLDVSTLDSGKVVAKVEVVAINEIIEDVIRQNGEALERSGSRLRHVACAAHVEVDRALLTTMLQNVVNNAIKYAPDSRILIGCRRRGARLSLGVYDQGPGIAAGHLPRVFEEFYQIRERGDRDLEGVGLGLPIVGRLARLLDLRIALRSTLSRGTSVVFHGIAIVRAPTRVPALRPPPQISAIDGLKILLVEDDEDVLVATASLLRRWGCEVQPETSTPSTIGPCDILITDFDLGDRTTGSDCIRTVRAHNRDAAVIVITGHDAGRVKEDIDDPSIPILLKPLRPAELRSVIMAKAMATRTPAARFSPR